MFRASLFSLIFWKFFGLFGIVSQFFRNFLGTYRIFSDFRLRIFTEFSGFLTFFKNFWDFFGARFSHSDVLSEFIRNFQIFFLEYLLGTSVAFRNFSREFQGTVKSKSICSIVLLGHGFCRM